MVVVLVVIAVVVVGINDLAIVEIAGPKLLVDEKLNLVCTLNVRGTFGIACGLCGLGKL